MRPWLIWSIVIGIIVIIAVTKFGIHIVCRNDDIRLRILVGPIRLKLKQKQEKKRKESAKSKRKPKAYRSKKRLDWKPWAKAILSHWDDMLALFLRVLRSPTFDLLKLYITVGGDEPDVNAINYGRTCAFIGGLLGPLESVFYVKKRQIDISCSWDGASTVYEAEAVLTLRVYEALALILVGFKLIVTLYFEVNNRKKEEDKI